MKSYLIAGFVLLGFMAKGQNNDAPVSKNAPKDAPVSISKAMVKKQDSIFAPYIKKARKTLNDAKKRWEKGLPAGQAFFVVTRIWDSLGHFEQIFVRVKTWNKKDIAGTIADNLDVVKGYRNGQLIQFKEEDVMDWCISHSDGTEEGNYIGKYLDSQHNKLP